MPPSQRGGGGPLRRAGTLYVRATNRMLAIALLLSACAARPPRPVTRTPSFVPADSGVVILDLDAALAVTDASLLAGDGSHWPSPAREEDGVHERALALTGGRRCRRGEGTIRGLDVPRAADFRGCAAEGTPGNDAPLNVLKNRTDEPPSRSWECRDVAWMLALPVPAGLPRQMRRYTDEQREAIASSSGRPVCVEGYLGGVKDEGGEATNCGGSGGADQHIYLVPDALPAGELARRADLVPRVPDVLVVETTPRVRVAHDTWTTAALRDLRRTQTRVRVCGWTMLDPEHANQVGRYRSTVWEIHPILHIDVRQDDGSWDEL